MYDPITVANLFECTPFHGISDPSVFFVPIFSAFSNLVFDDSIKQHPENTNTLKPRYSTPAYKESRQ